MQLFRYVPRNLGSTQLHRKRSSTLYVDELHGFQHIFYHHCVCQLSPIGRQSLFPSAARSCPTARNECGPAGVSGAVDCSAAPEKDVSGAVHCSRKNVVSTKYMYTYFCGSYRLHTHINTVPLKRAGLPIAYTRGLKSRLIRCSRARSQQPFVEYRYYSTAVQPISNFKFASRLQRIIYCIHFCTIEQNSLASGSSIH